ncbi:hypothetical protein SNEBB_003731 [Seison nebaliae]|nr:hypothetical protein SNEBB_003731 [Seison nebaliae]
MTNQKNLSKGEIEIERCRLECEWSRLGSMKKMIMKPNSIDDCLSSMIHLESELEQFISLNITNDLEIINKKRDELLVLDNSIDRLLQSVTNMMNRTTVLKETVEMEKLKVIKSQVMLLCIKSSLLKKDDEEVLNLIDRFEKDFHHHRKTLSGMRELQLIIESIICRTCVMMRRLDDITKKKMTNVPLDRTVSNLNSFQHNYHSKRGDHHSHHSHHKKKQKSNELNSDENYEIHHHHKKSHEDHQREKIRLMKFLHLLFNCVSDLGFYFIYILTYHTATNRNEMPQSKVISDIDTYFQEHDGNYIKSSKSDEEVREFIDFFHSFRDILSKYNYNKEFLLPFVNDVILKKAEIGVFIEWGIHTASTFSIENKELKKAIGNFRYHLQLKPINATKHLRQILAFQLSQLMLKGASDIQNSNSDETNKKMCPIADSCSIKSELVSKNFIERKKNNKLDDEHPSSFGRDKEKSLLNGRNILPSQPRQFHKALKKQSDRKATRQLSYSSVVVDIDHDNDNDDDRDFLKNNLNLNKRKKFKRSAASVDETNLRINNYREKVIDSLSFETELTHEKEYLANKLEESLRNLKRSRKYMRKRRSCSSSMSRLSHSSSLSRQLKKRALPSTCYSEIHRLPSDLKMIPNSQSKYRIKRLKLPKSFHLTILKLLPLSNAFTPISDEEETILVLYISHELACQIRKEAEANKTVHRLTQSAIEDSLNLLTIFALRYNQPRLLYLPFENSMRFSFENFHIWYQFSLILYTSGERQRSYLMLKQCHKMDRSNVQILLHLGRMAFEDFGWLNESTHWLQEAISLYKHQIVNSGGSFELDNKKDIEVIPNYYGNNLPFFRGYLLYGIVLYLKAFVSFSETDRNSMFNSAIDKFQYAVDIDPNDANIYFYHALVLAHQRKLKQAVNMLMISFNYSKYSMKSLHLYVLLLTGQKKYEEAYRTLNSLIKEFSAENDINLLYTKAKIEEKILNIDNSIDTTHQMLLIWNEHHGRNNLTVRSRSFSHGTKNRRLNHNSLKHSTIRYRKNVANEEKESYFHLQSLPNHSSRSLSLPRHFGQGIANPKTKYFPSAAGSGRECQTALPIAKADHWEATVQMEDLFSFLTFGSMEYEQSSFSDSPLPVETSPYNFVGQSPEKPLENLTFVLMNHKNQKSLNGSVEQLLAILYYYCDLFIEHGKLDQAKATLAEIQRYQPFSYQFLLARAKLLNEYLYEEILRQMHVTFTHDDENQKNCVQSLFDIVGEYAKSSLSLNPKHVPTLQFYAKHLAQISKPAVLLHQIQTEIHEINEAFDECGNQLCDKWTRIGVARSTNIASKLIQDALIIDSHDYHSLEIMGDILMVEGKEEEANEYYKLSIQNEMTSPILPFNHCLTSNDIGTSSIFW